MKTFGSFENITDFSAFPDCAASQPIAASVKVVMASPVEKGFHALSCPPDSSYRKYRRHCCFPTLRVPASNSAQFMHSLRNDKKFTDTVTEKLDIHRGALLRHVLSPRCVLSPRRSNVQRCLHVSSPMRRCQIVQPLHLFSLDYICIVYRTHTHTQYI